MNIGAKRMAVCSVLTALSVAVLFLSSVLPSGKLAVCAVSALLPAVAMILYDTKWAVLVYSATSIISMLILPTRAVALIYTLILGYYTITKSLIERLEKPVLEWFIKIIVFNIGVLALYLIYVYVFKSELLYALWLLLLGANAIFILYDIALTRLFNGYLLKIIEKLR